MLKTVARFCVQNSISKHNSTIGVQQKFLLYANCTIVLRVEFCIQICTKLYVIIEYCTVLYAAIYINIVQYCTVFVQIVQYT